MFPVLAALVLAQAPGALPSDAPTVAQEPPAGEQGLAPLLGRPAGAQAAAPGLQPMDPLRLILVSTGATAAFIGSMSAGIAVSVAILEAQFKAAGRPDPFATSSAIVGGFGTTVILSQLLVPGTMLLADERAAAGSFEDAWRVAWRRSRWAVAAGAVASALLFGGAALEAQQFGQGQSLLLAGAMGMLGATFTYGALEVTGAIAGYNASRIRRDL